MGAFESIGDAEAKGCLAESQAIGKTVTLTHRDGSSATLSVLIMDQSLGRVKFMGLEREVGMIEFMIPVQTGFAAMTTATRPITVGDRIEYPVSSGRYFWVDSDADIDQMSNGYIYLVKAKEHKTLTMGVSA